MSDTILLATKKGTLLVDRANGRWTPRPISHAGMAVSYAARDPRDAKMTQTDAIIGMRYDATEFAAGVTEVLAYGTAVKLLRE